MRKKNTIKRVGGVVLMVSLVFFIQIPDMRVAALESRGCLFVSSAGILLLTDNIFSAVLVIGPAQHSGILTSDNRIP